MKTLISGANLPLSHVETRLEFSYQLAHGELDVSAYLLDQQTGKVRGDADMLFYGQKSTPNGAVRLDISTNQVILHVNTAQIDSTIGKIAICATIDKAENLSVLKHLNFSLRCGGEIIANAQENEKLRSEAALILAEVYRHNGTWKCRWVMQGFNGGLQPLAEHFGVEIAHESTTAPSTQPSTTSSHSNPPSPPPVNLSKITLDKNNSRVSLTKQAEGFGQIRINLNWNRNSQSPKKGFFSNLLGGGGIDLDLGAMIRLKNGEIHLVQALGEAFGSLHSVPFAELQGDDRTGEAKEGEWLFINGKHWDKIEQIVIYCFIYSGVANWAQTDGLVRVFVPNQPPIEVELTEGNDRLGLCGIVELRNQSGNIDVTRVMKYFSDQQKLDQHFGFGFRWKAGRK